MTSTATARQLSIVPASAKTAGIADAVIAWADSASDLAVELRKVDYDTGLTARDREALRCAYRAQRDVLDTLIEILEAGQD